MIGILNVLKPKGKTSHDVVSFVRRNLHMKRVGHTGTLDPDAEGVLPILVGKATKLSDLIMASEKRYIAKVQLGVITDTEDLSGNILEKKEVNVTEKEVTDAVMSFLGEIEQIPPMYSAIKVDGQKLYQLARKGIVTERKPRKITIHSLDIKNFNGNSFDLDVHCSKGTYIRALCRDIGEKLGCGAAMGALTRTQSGNFFIENAHTLEEIEKAAKDGTIESLLISIEDVLTHIKRVDVNEENAAKVKNGIRLRPSQLKIEEYKKDELFCIYEENELICILKVIESETEGLVLAMEKSFY